MYVYIFLYIYIYILSYLCVYIHLCAYIYVCIHIYVLGVYIYIYMYIYVCVCIYIYIYIQHHHGMPLAQISQMLFCQTSLSSIAFGRSSIIYPVSIRSCYKLVLAGRPTLALPLKGSTGVHCLWAHPYYPSSGRMSCSSSLHGFLDVR